MDVEAVYAISIYGNKQSYDKHVKSAHHGGIYTG